MWGFLLNAAGNAVAFLLANPSNVTSTDVRDGVVGIITSIKLLVAFLQALFADEMTAWKKAGPNVVDGGKGIGDLAYHEEYAWDRLLHTILPGSQRWQQYNTRQYAGPRFDRIWRFLVVLDKRTKFFAKWRTSYVNPTLAEWTRFRRFYFTWPNDTVAILHNWLTQPARFAKWATPVLVPSFLSWLNAKPHQSQRDDWTRIIVGSVPDMPDQIGFAVLQVLEGPVHKR